MDIEAKDATWLMRAFSFAAGVIATGAVTLYKVRDHGQRIAKLEADKVGQADCKYIQESHIEKFLSGADQFNELKQLIKASNEIQDRRLRESDIANRKNYEDIMKMFVENLRQ